ncbi:hypothetical protein CTAYLR_009577 [Chrysophaeum taylorii]|uniref:Aminotransferase class I/classII large domain-containing protein n=1 Tax=Chrysophaeum taylorii TaxID=2483200 RepID=A0AAD7XRV8_9STRA|nr:hypothetical protein CTAYLR_009577 [Chrysophaeum taylorii]
MAAAATTARKLVTPHPSRHSRDRVEARTTALVALPFEMQFSSLGSKLERSPIRTATNSARAAKERGEDVVSLAGGLPSAELFAMRSMSVDGVEVEGADDVLQYHSGKGNPGLLEKVARLQHSLHEGKYGIACTTGNTDALVKTIELLTEPGDPVFTETPTWPGFLSQLAPRDRAAVGVAMDERGVIPHALDAALAKETGTQQRVFYTVPAGQNPTGVTVDDDRKRQIYEICRRRNVVIVEDDPYYFLRLDGNPLSASYLSLDRDGRVVRLDSASKILAPGIRLGWISGPELFVEKYVLLAETSTQFPSGLAQLAVSHLLDRDFSGHLDRIAADYRRRRDLLVTTLEENLDATLADWNLPTCGMFLWVKQHVSPDARHLVDDFVEKGVAVVPGHCFATTRDLQCPYFRLTFAFGSDDDIRKGAARIAAVLKDKAANE